MIAAVELRNALSHCALCPRSCGVDRLRGEIGFCGIGPEAFVASAAPHFGEEPPLVGSGGSGTIFFAGCNLGCVFCQNHDISHGRAGREVTAERLARLMLELQSVGCHNINWVTPTHQIVAVVEALRLARENGLDVPIVYNCGGYESVETLRRIEGLVDIYMPDAKFARTETAKKYLNAPDYPAVMKAAIREMHRQVGDLEIRNGLAVRGLLVRHLVMPGGVEEAKTILDFLAEEISSHTVVNVMAQYRPYFRANEFPVIARPVSPDEYAAARKYAQRLGMRF